MFELGIIRATKREQNKVGVLGNQGSPQREDLTGDFWNLSKYRNKNISLYPFCHNS